MMDIKIPLLFFIFLLIPSVNAYEIVGNSVVEEDENVYFSITPHTLTQSGYQEIKLISKTYSGNIDVAFGFNKEGANPLILDVNTGDSWINIASSFNKVTHDFQGYDTWYIAKNLNVNAGQEYTTRMYLDIPFKRNGTSGKYFVAVKPSSETIAQAIANGHFYYIDPWWNVSLGFRYNIINTSTLNTLIPYSINDNTTVNGTPLWTTFNSGCLGQPKVYSGLSGPAGNLAVANETTQCNWENSSTLTGNNPTSIYPSSILGWWHFDDNTSTNDSSQADNDGINTGGTSTSAVIKNGISFSNSDANVNFGAAILPTGDKTVNFWIITTGNPGNIGCLMTNNPADLGDTGTGLSCYLTTASQVRCTVGNAGGADHFYSLQSTTTIPNKRTMITFVQNATGAFILHNAVTDWADTSSDGPEVQGANNLKMGDCYTAGDFDYKDIIDEPAAWDRGLSVAEIQQLYKNGMGTLTSLGAEEKVDEGPPIITIITPTNTTFSSPIDINATSNVTIDTWWFEYNGNGTNITFATGGTSANTSLVITDGDGAKNLTVYANNTVGTTNSTTVFFTVDIGAPTVTIVSPQNISYNDTKIFFLANSTDVDEDTWFYWISVDGTNITSNQSYTENVNVSIKDFLPINKVFQMNVWVNDTIGNQNTTSVFFTVNTTNQTNITIEPTTPPSGGGGGYDVDLNFTANLTAAATVDGYEPFTIRANLFVTDTSITFDTPVIRFSESNVNVGSWNLHYVRGSNNNVTYERTVTMPPGVYSYFIEVEASNGITYFSTDHFINVRVPSSENISGVILPASAFFDLLVTFTDETTPKSHSRVSQSDGIYVSGTALNVNGTVSNVTLFILNEAGTSIISTTGLNSANNGNGTWSLFGFSTLPENITRITIQLGVIDSSDRAAYSVSRKIIVLSENQEGIIKTSMFPFLNPFGDEGEGGGIAPGRIFAATLIMVVLIGGLYASGAGTMPAVAFGVVVSIEFATFNIIPTWVSILGAVLIGMVMARTVLNMWLRR